MARFYSFAGITWRITGDPENLYREDGVLAPFRTEGPDYDYSLDFAIVDTLPGPEGERIFESPARQCCAAPRAG